MSEHTKNNAYHAHGSRRGGKRLAAGPAPRRRETGREERQAAASTAVKPLIPEWAEEQPSAVRAERRPRRSLKAAVRSWQESDGEISPAVTAYYALQEKL